ncbi:MAG TPA: hypothetical protein VED40_07155 [Azospirillaceae bacterium]|nr:hypothetical protein [Azospirillaceae bacterium]
MTLSEKSRQHAVETLAETLYAGANPTGVPWGRRDAVLQDRWRDAARLRLAKAEEPRPARG